MATEATPVDQSGWEGSDPRALYVVSVYAEFDDAEDHLNAVFGGTTNPLVIETSDPSGFWQFDANGLGTPGDYNTSAQIAAGLSADYASVTSDSFVTIGLTNSTDNQLQNIGIDFTSFNDASGTSALSVDNGSWFITPNNTQGTAGNYPGLRVLVGQFTVGGGETVSGSVSLQWKADGVNQDTYGVSFGSTAVGTDCNDNGEDDIDELSNCDGSPWCSDCNENGILDQCDVNVFGLPDCDGDGIPDVCETDCDGDGIIDDCESDPDQDGDGVPDCRDGCPNDPLKTTEGICGCDVPDTDSDGDGTPDCNDNCPLDDQKTEPGICGCGYEDTDTDGDTIADCNDAFPDDVTEWTDSDGDGIGDNGDPCPYWPGNCSADGQTLYVVPGDVIQDAIDGASDGGVVELAPGTYSTGAPWGDHVVALYDKSITLRASGTPEETIIDGGGVRGGIAILWTQSSMTVIDGLTITGCVAGSSGGGIHCYSSSPTIINCTIVGNTATGHGGGVSCGDQSSPTITNCTITENSAEYGGGIGCQWSSYPVITDCMITNNTASEQGGGVSSDTGMTGSNATIGNTTVCENSPNQIFGSYSDEGGNSIDAVCEVPSCDADISGNGSVDGTDLTMIIELWGLETPFADIDGDGLVGIADLLTLLENWGPCA